MNILETLKNDESCGIRLTYGCRWMIYDTVTDVWCVYEREPYKKKTVSITETTDEELAVENLLKG